MPDKKPTFDAEALRAALPDTMTPDQLGAFMTTIMADVYGLNRQSTILMCRYMIDVLSGAPDEMFGSQTLTSRKLNS